MSVPQHQTLTETYSLFAVRPVTHCVERGRHVRFVPKPALSTAQKYLAADRLRPSDLAIVCQQLPVGHWTRGFGIIGHRLFERERDAKHFQV